MNNIPRVLRRSHSAHGYTLIEIMLVLSIISVLLGAGIYYLIGNLDIAKERRVQADIATFTTQLKTYEMENLFMPTTEQGLAALVQEPTTDPKPRRWRQGGHRFTGFSRGVEPGEAAADFASGTNP